MREKTISLVPFFFFFCPGSNISCSRTGTTSSCTCHIRCQLLECQFHVTVSCLSQTLCNQQPWGSRGNLTFFQHCRHLDNILLLLESTVQSHSACIQEDLLVLGQHNLTRSSRLLPAAPSSQDCCWAQIQGSLQEQAQARRSLRAPENSSSGFSAGMLLLIILPAPTSFQFLKCFPQSGMVLQTHVIPEGSSLQIQVLDTSSFCLDDNRSVAHPFLLITHFEGPTPVLPQTKSLQLITSYWPPIPGPQDFFFHPHDTFWTDVREPQRESNQAGWTPYRCKLPPICLRSVALPGIFCSMTKKKIGFLPLSTPGSELQHVPANISFSSTPLKLLGAVLAHRGAISMGKGGVKLKKRDLLQLTSSPSCFSCLATLPSKLRGSQLQTCIFVTGLN